MEYSKCDIKKHNLQNIAELIYQTEPDFTKLLFGKNKSKAISNIIKLIKNKNNTFSSKNISLYQHDKKITGILIGYSGDETNKEEEKKAVSETLDIFASIRLSIYEKLLVNRLLTTEIKPDDFYISVLNIDEKFRRKGIGKNLISNAIKIAREKKCTRIILDVSKENENAIKFYKKVGLKIYEEVNTKLFFQKISVYKMELLVK
jgi:ribosomal protein S18 acetylase RimI-like enzyme